MSRESVLALIRRKDELQIQIDALREQLARHGVTEFDTLLTLDGFPRADLDIPTIRGLRVELIREENDLRALLEEIAEELKTAFPPKSEGAENPSAPRPLGRIRAVVSGSAGDDAGLRADDLVLVFGAASKLSEFNEVLAHAVESREPLHVVVQRAPEWQSMTLEVNVAPGRSLGCHVVSA